MTNRKCAKLFSDDAQREKEDNDNAKISLNYTIFCKE